MRRSAQYWHAQAFLDRAAGRFELAVTRDSIAERLSLCGEYGDLPSGGYDLPLGVRPLAPYVDQPVTLDQARTAVQMLYVGEGLSDRVSLHADLGGVS